MNLSKSAINSVLLIAEKIVIIGFAFAVSVLLARLGGPDLFGQYAYITSFASLFAPLTAMGLNNIVTKYVVRYPHNSHFYVKSALVIRLIGAFSAIVIGCIGLLLFNQYDDSTGFIVWLLAFQSLNAFLIYEYFFLAKQQVYSTLKIRMIVAVLANVAKIVVILDDPNLSMLVLIQCIEYSLIALLYHLLYRQQKHQLSITRPANLHAVKVLLHKGKWLLLSGIAAVIYLKIDQLMLANMVSTEAVAYYAAAAKLSEFWYVFPVLITNAYTARIIEQRQRSDKQLNHYMLNMLSIFILAALMISLITFSFSTEIITLIYGEKYHQSSAILNIHIFASLFIFQRAIFSKWLIITNHLSFSLLTHGIGAIINIAMNLILIPHYEGIGAAWATLISYMFASYVALFFHRNTRPFALLMTQAMLQWPKYLFLMTKKSENHHV